MDLTRTPTSATALAAALAILGDGVPAPVAGRLAGLGTEDAERAADALAAAGVLAGFRPLRFAHSAMRVVIYASLPPGERAIAHRRAVRVLADAGATPVAIAPHACAVEPAADPAVAEVLIAAGRSALSSADPRTAALLFERALAEPPPPPARASARLLLGRALTLLGDPRAAAVTYQSLGDAEPADRERLADELIDALWLTGGADAALSLARQTAGAEPAGIAAARAARDGSLPAVDVVRAAALGVRGATAFERCCAIAALIACDELDAAGDAQAECTSAARRRGAIGELAVLARLRTRLSAVEGGGAVDATSLAGPDPGPSPWHAWGAQTAERFGTPSARAYALLAADGGEVDPIERAVDLLRGSPRQADLARALLCLGRGLRHTGRRRDARAMLTEAMALALRLGLSGLASDARDELRVAGARPRRDALTGPGALTAAERRVADSAAAGRSNREVAEHLFLSPKTIEMHLGRIYRKLEIRSRGELADALGLGVKAA